MTNLELISLKVFLDDLIDVQFVDNCWQDAQREKQEVVKIIRRLWTEYHKLFRVAKPLIEAALEGRSMGFRNGDWKQDMRDALALWEELNSTNKKELEQ